MHETSLRTIIESAAMSDAYTTRTIEVLDQADAIARTITVSRAPSQRELFDRAIARLRLRSA